MAKVVDLSGKEIVPGNNDDMHEYVCEHCGNSRFRDVGPHGECRLNPPTAGMVVLPVNTLQGMQLQAQQYSIFPVVERRMYCYQFVDKEPETSE
jgi:hypothetical protein